MLSIRRPYRYTIENVPMGVVDWNYDSYAEDVPYSDLDPHEAMWWSEEQWEAWFREIDSEGYPNAIDLPNRTALDIYNGDRERLETARGIGAIIGQAAEWVLAHQDEAVALYRRLTGETPPDIPPPTKPPNGGITADPMFLILLAGLGALAFFMIKK